LEQYNDIEKIKSFKKKFDIAFEVVTDIEKATGDSDIIITVTPS